MRVMGASLCHIDFCDLNLYTTVDERWFHLVSCQQNDFVLLNAHCPGLPLSFGFLLPYICLC